MKSDAEEILDEMEKLIIDNENEGGYYVVTEVLYEYIRNKRLEFVEPQGDCV